MLRAETSPQHLSRTIHHQTAAPPNIITSRMHISTQNVINPGLITHASFLFGKMPRKAPREMEKKCWGFYY